jgi:hypothetical protein
MELPVIAGTEMNSPGQKFVDSFETAELAPLVPTFLKGAYIVYAHSVLMKYAGFGYIGEWASRNFQNAAEKNEFFHQFGQELQVEREDLLAGLGENITPAHVLRKIR